MGEPAPDASEETTDAIFHGMVPIVQSRRGYRFNFDSLALAYEAASAPFERFLDVGAGVGVIALALAHWSPRSVGLAVEVQPTMAARLRRNLAANGLDGRVAAWEGDIRALARARPALDVAGGIGAARFDLVVMNPPYFDPATSQVSTEPERAAARHRLHGSIDALVGAAASWLAPTGRLVWIVPPRDVDASVRAARAAGLGGMRLRELRPFADAAAVAVIATASGSATAQGAAAAGAAARDGAQWSAPFVTYAAPGVYTDEAAHALRGPEERT